VSDVYSPVNGVIAERNEALADRPELVNQSPYGEGWLVIIEVTDPSEVEGLMEAAAYQAFLQDAAGT
jgi:glycine cleavage system H protein